MDTEERFESRAKLIVSSPNTSYIGNLSNESTMMSPTMTTTGCPAKITALDKIPIFLAYSKPFLNVEKNLNP